MYLAAGNGEARLAWAMKNACGKKKLSGHTENLIKEKLAGSPLPEESFSARAFFYFLFLFFLNRTL